MRTFEFSGAGSHKFWNIDMAGTSFTVTFGKIGTAGKSQTKSFDTEEAAEAEAEKLIKQKTKKGYRETTPSTSAPASLREAMEQAIVENPDDMSSYMALADHLEEENDSQGEFIRVQLALEDESTPESKWEWAQKRERELLEEHRLEWAGDWVNTVSDESFEDGGQLPFPAPKPVRFRRGLPWDAVFEELNVKTALAFRDDPKTRTIQRLYISGASWEEDELDEKELKAAGLTEDQLDDEPSMYVMLRWPYLKNLRVLQLGWTSDENYGDFCSHRCHQSGDWAFDFVKQTPNLEELYLFAHCSTEVGQIMRADLPRLRVLQVYHSYTYPLVDLAKNKSMGNLTHLLCHPHALEEDPMITLADVRAIVNSKTLTSLTHLRLRLSTMGDKGAEAIVKSGILKRLKMLDLRHGCIGDDGAKALAKCPDLKNLESLDLSRNQLGDEGIEALQATGVTLDVSHQHAEVDPNELDNAEFLYEGDYE